MKGGKSQLKCFYRTLVVNPSITTANFPFIKLFRDILDRLVIFALFHAFLREKGNMIRFSLKTEKKAVEISKTFSVLRKTNTDIDTDTCDFQNPAKHLKWSIF